ncbi:MAG: hypothetical protein VYC46_04975 [Pseudomonadota bacterium]|nr:hypothetical protein [Pseudomonadota bacterium]|tara:strand:- start:1261 stop:1701 length:441 start_codon:yes stop_codon:yes gene_type:complete
MKKHLLLLSCILFFTSCTSVDNRLNIENVEEVSTFASNIENLLSELEFLKLEVLKLNSSKPPIQRILNEADAFWIRGNLDQTNLQLERALRISKNEGPIYLRLAHLRIEQGLNKEAKAFAAKGLLINNLSNWERLLLNVYFQHDNS